MSASAIFPAPMNPMRAVMMEGMPKPLKISGDKLRTGTVQGGSLFKYNNHWLP